MKNILNNHALGITIAVVSGAIAGWFSDNTFLIISTAVVGGIMGEMLEKRIIVR